MKCGVMRDGLVGESFQQTQFITASGHSDIQVHQSKDDSGPQHCQDGCGDPG